MADKKVLMSLDDIMGDRFGKYSKYIIQERALPDVRDGLKPVQRRILYAMYKEGNVYSKSYRKSAKTVGNVIGNYHPHGDSSVYDAMVRLSQEWKMRIPLVDMQGNNGSIDNDPAAAMRYTEARLSAISEELLKDIDKDTVLMTLNFDDTEYEPTVLPAYFPNLLINGSSGIAAGYATNIPPHNPNEVIDATIYRIKNPACTLDDLMKYVKGPDFPTGAIVEGKDGIRAAYKKGKGKVIIRSKTEIIEQKKNNQIVISEIPFEVNKGELVRKIDDIRINKTIDGIEEVRDESDRTGLRIVIDLKKDIDVQNTLNYLFKNTNLQISYNYNMIAIKDKRPVLLSLEDAIDGYIEHQIDVITKRSIYDLNKTKKRMHIVLGLIKAISILDQVVATIRKSKDKNNATDNLVELYEFTYEQAEAIVMLQLYRLTNTDIISLENEHKELENKLNYLNSILDSDEVLRQVIIDILLDIKTKYNSPRLTKIKSEIQDITIDTTAMIASEDIYVQVTRDGYIKRISSRSLKASEGNPIGKKDDDLLVGLWEVNTLNILLLFTNQGNYLYIPVHTIEEFKYKDVGKHVSYLVKLNSDEKIIDAIIVTDFNLPLFVLTSTKYGQIKRTKLSEFNVQRYSKPIKAINLKDSDELISAKLTNDQKGIVLVTNCGYGLVYNEQEVSELGIKAGGIKALKMNNDYLVGVETFDLQTKDSLVVVTEDLGIKRFKVDDIPFGKRTVKGSTLYKNLKSHTFKVVKIAVLPNKSDFVITTNDLVEHKYNLNDFSYSNLEQKPKIMEKLDSGISVIGLYYDSKPITLLDKHKIDLNKIEIEKKDSSFQQISLDDIFNN